MPFGRTLGTPKNIILSPHKLQSSEPIIKLLCAKQVGGLVCLSLVYDNQSTAFALHLIKTL